MGDVIADIVPVAIGVAVSPIPVVAVILLLFAPRARATSVAFALGWVASVLVLVCVVALVVDPATGSGESGRPAWVSVVEILLGAVALALAERSWRSRPEHGEGPQMPAWMQAIDTMTPARAVGMAALLVAVNPKNLTLCLSGALTIGAAGLPAGQGAVSVAVFVAVASSSVVLPVVGFVVAQQRMAEPLLELRAWLTLHNAAMMSVLLLVLGAKLMGQGIAGL